MAIESPWIALLVVAGIIIALITLSPEIFLRREALPPQPNITNQTLEFPPLLPPLPNETFIINETNITFPPLPPPLPPLFPPLPNITNETFIINETNITNQTIAQNQTLQAASIAIEADDFGFYKNGNRITSLEVPMGDVVLFIYIRPETTYVGGLDFRSDLFNVGGEGGDNVTISFSASQSFTLSSFWPNTNTKKADLEIIVV